MAEIWCREENSAWVSARRLIWPVGALALMVVVSVGLETAGFGKWAALLPLASGFAVAGWWWQRLRRNGEAFVGPARPGTHQPAGDPGPERRMRLAILFSHVARGRIEVDGLLGPDRGSADTGSPQPVALVVARPRSLLHDALVVAFIEECTEDGRVVDLVVKGQRRGLLYKDETEVAVDFLQPVPSR